MKFWNAAPPMSSPLKENRDAQLDELRGLAICAVLASHVALVFANDFALARAALLPALGVGVDLFFVISGFLIVDRAARSMANAGGLLAWRGGVLGGPRDPHWRSGLGDDRRAVSRLAPRRSCTGSALRI